MRWTGCILLLILIGRVMVDGAAAQTGMEATQPAVQPDYNLFDQLLKHHVSPEGEVDYAAIQSSDSLDQFLDYLASIDPASLSQKEALALWINAYNAYTIKLVVDNYPVSSIREITPIRIKGWWLAVPKINSPFEYEIANVGGEMYSLDDIEHGILRKQFEESRIHFALVCASYSCPPLRREAFVADRLDEQLDDQARVFLHDPVKNRIDAGEKNIYISRIFRWFKEDFTRDGNTVQEYLAPYFEGKTGQMLRENAFGIKYLKYDWRLNDVGSFNN